MSVALGDNSRPERPAQIRSRVNDAAQFRPEPQDAVHRYSECRVLQLEPKPEAVYHGTSISSVEIEPVAAWFTDGMPGRYEDASSSNKPISIAGLVYLSAHAGVKYSFENHRGCCGLVFEFRLTDLENADAGLRLVPDEDFLKGLSLRDDPRVAVQHRLSDGRFNPRMYEELWRDSLLQYGSFAVDGPLPVRCARRIAMLDRTKDVGGWLDTSGGLNLNLETIAELAPFFSASTALYFDGTPMPEEMFDAIDGTWYAEDARAAFLTAWEDARQAWSKKDVLVRPASGWVPSDVVAAITAQCLRRGPRAG